MTSPATPPASPAAAPAPPPGPELPWWLHGLGLAALTVVGLGIQLVLRSQPWLGWGTLGDDAQFWLARAAALSGSPFVGARPPGYPLLVWLLAPVLGQLRAGMVVAGLAGALLPVAGASVATRLGGRRAGLLAGLLTLGLPCLVLAGLLSEATTLYGLAVAGVMHAGLHFVARPVGARALLLGAAVAGACLVKEQGVVLLPGMVLVPLLLRPARPVAALGVVLGWALPLLPFVLAELASPQPGVLGKLVLPLVDMWAWFDHRAIPSPLMVHNAYDAPLDPGLPGAGRLRIFWSELRRAAGFAGPWTLLAPLGLALAAGGRARLARGPLLVVLGVALGAVPVVLVPVLERHVELSLLPLVWCVGLLGRPPAQRRRPRVALLHGLLVLGVVGVVLARGAGWAGHRLGLVRDSARENAAFAALAAEVRAELPPGARLCTLEAWMAAFSEVPVDCRPPGPALGPVTLLVERRRLRLCFPEVAARATEVGPARPAEQLLVEVEDRRVWSGVVEKDCGTAGMRPQERVPAG